MHVIIHHVKPKNASRVSRVGTINISQFLNLAVQKKNDNDNVRCWQLHIVERSHGLKFALYRFFFVVAKMKEKHIHLISVYGLRSTLYAQKWIASERKNKKISTQALIVIFVVCLRKERCRLNSMERWKHNSQWPSSAAKLQWQERRRWRRNCLRVRGEWLWGLPNRSVGSQWWNRCADAM